MMQNHNNTKTLLEEALGYAAMGYPVLPLEEGGKRPHPAAGPRGFYAASTNPIIIEGWFKTRPGINIGLVPPDGVVVFDFDTHTELEAFLRRFPSMKTSPRSLTPRGAHVWASIPKGVRLRSKSPAPLPRFELKRPWTGYVVEYPSKTPSGLYVWEIPLLPPEELKPVPIHLLNALTIQTRPARAASTKTFERVVRRFEREAVEGNRHPALIAALTALIGGGAPWEYVERVKAIALERGLPDHEVEDAIAWGRRTLAAGEGSDD